MIRQPPRPPLFPYPPLFPPLSLPLSLPAAVRHSARSSGRCSGRRRSLLDAALPGHGQRRSEEHTSELQSRSDLVCRLLLEKKKDPDLLLVLIMSSLCSRCRE